MALEWIYLLKVNVGIALFYAFYKLFCQRDTFFRWRRISLLAFITISFLYPLIDIQQWVQSQPAINELGNIYANWLVLEEVEVLTTPDTVQVPDNVSIITYIYCIGVILLSIRFIIQLCSIIRMRFMGKVEEMEGHRIISMPTEVSPFSFFQWIFIYKPSLEEDSQQEILTHEQTHAEQGHSFDVIFSEIANIVCWFNPFMWLLKGEIRLNLEYLADKKVADSLQQDTKVYQYHLLGLASQKNKTGLYNNFNVSHLKRRIIMMNKKKSNGMRMLKAAFVPAVMFVAAISFARTESSEVLPVKEENPVLEPGISKIKEMEEASSRYAKNLKLFPKEIRESEVVNVLMNRWGDVMYRNGKQRIEPGYLSSVYGHLRKLNPTFVILVTDVSASAAELDKLINETYLYYTRHASDVHPVYFYSTTVDFHSTKSANRHKESSSKRRVVSEKTGKEYEKLWMMLHSSGLIQNAPPKSANAFIVDTLKPLVRVIDDDDAMRRSWAFLIEGEGWDVATYSNAIEFITSNDFTRPGCIVLDVRMPSMSGLELQDKLREMGVTLPIIFISGHGDINLFHQEGVHGSQYGICLYSGQCSGGLEHRCRTLYRVRDRADIILCPRYFRREHSRRQSLCRTIPRKYHG